MINIHDIRNNMYHSINLHVHSSDPSIHRYGTHICQSFFTHGDCPFSFTHSSSSSNSLWFPNPWRINTGHHTSLSISYEWCWVSYYFYHNWSPYLLPTQLMCSLYHALFSLKSTSTEMKLVYLISVSLSQGRIRLSLYL